MLIIRAVCVCVTEFMKRSAKSWAHLTLRQGKELLALTFFEGVKSKRSKRNQVQRVIIGLNLAERL